MVTHQLHASSQGLDHGHVMSIERRLTPWQIDLRVVEHAGVVEWHLASPVTSEREMLRHLQQAVRRETGFDAVRRDPDEQQPDVAQLDEGPDALPELPVIL